MSPGQHCHGQRCNIGAGTPGASIEHPVSPTNQKRHAGDHSLPSGSSDPEMAGTLLTKKRRGARQHASVTEFIRLGAITRNPTPIKGRGAFCPHRRSDDPTWGQKAEGSLALFGVEGALIPPISLRRYWGNSKHTHLHIRAQYYQTLYQYPPTARSILF